MIILLDFLTALMSYAVCLLLFAGIQQISKLYVRSAFYVICALVIYPIINALFGVYRIIHRYAQPAEYIRYLISFSVSGVLLGIAQYALAYMFQIQRLPMYFVAEVSAVNVGAMIVTRLLYQYLSGRTEGKDYRKKNKKADGKRTLLVGCGQACLMLLTELRYHPELGIRPVVAVDQDGNKIGRNIAGIPIAGTNDDIVDLCRKYEIEQIIVAIPSADNTHRAEIIGCCRGLDVSIKMLPRLAEFKGETVVSQLRDITMEELLGREPIEINHTEINAFIRGKTVLVTGGGGSIGSELCRQIAANQPKKLIILDIYENNAYDIQQELAYKYHDELDFETIIASVRDFDRINQIMAEYKPNLVIHAAAHKHVPLMEVSPQEAIKNNVFGTYNTARAAIRNGVARFILISTDKAVNPTNVMGASKRMCEMVIQSLNGRGTVFSAVRFGNVLGSNGSVVPLFKKQIENGGPVTVTHPDIIRFFMTIPEAVQLVLLACAKAEGGEIFVLNMGSPVRIADLAKRIIELSGKRPDIDIKIEYTGLRPGEKLYEELMMEDEHLEKTGNEMIFIGHFVDFDRDAMETNLASIGEIANNNALTDEQMKDALEMEIGRIVPTFNHKK